jgi:hypothetical protein
MPGPGTNELPVDHVVQEGETLRSIASAYGYVDWKAIWEHEANAALRTERKYPVVRPGDTLHVPEKQPREDLCETGGDYTFRLKPPTDVFVLVLRDDSGLPHAGRDYVLELDEQEIEGSTDTDGAIVEDVPAGTKKGRLTVWISEDPDEPPVTWELRFGKSAPAEDVAWFQERLNRLDFDAGPVTGSMNDRTRAALEALQRYAQMEEVSGKADDPTRKAILRIEAELLGSTSEGS